MSVDESRIVMITVEASQEAALRQQIQTAHTLIQKCQQHKDIKGIDKLKRKCVAELHYLKRLEGRNAPPDQCHLSSSNLGHLQAILQVVETYPDIEEVLKRFRACQCAEQRPPLIVDVVCNHGNKWVKVIARKAQAVHLIWAGQGQFGDKSIMDHANHYLHCRTHHPHEYVEPKVVFNFCQGVTSPLQDALVRLGVTVEGTLQAVCEDVKEKLQGLCPEVSPEARCDGDVYCDSTAKEIVLEMSQQEDGEDATTVVPPDDQTELTGDRMSTVLPPGDQASIAVVGPSRSLGDETSGESKLKTEDSIKKVNLDITTVICLISNLCHGHCNYVFQDDVLSFQAEQERKNPVLPSLHEFMQGKELLISETALKDFQTILSTVGGEREKKRAKEFLTRVTVVPDCPTPRTQLLKESGRIKGRPKGVNYVVFLHEPRALTERKEKTATLLHH